MFLLEMKMKKHIFLSVLFILLCGFGFNSCLIYWGEFDPDSPSYTTSEPAIKFLRQQGYPGSFSSCRKINLANRYKDSWYNEYEYYQCYSSSLRKNVIVRCKKGYYSSTSFNTFESNYLYLKYQNELQDCERIKSSVSPYFDDYKILIDADWLFTDMYQKSTNLTNLKSEMTSTPYFILIKLTTEETNQIQKNSSDLLKIWIERASEKLYNSGYKGYKKFCVLKTRNPENLSDFDSVDYFYDGYGRYSFDFEYEVQQNSKTVQQIY